MSIEAMKQALELLRKKEWEACDYTSNASEAADILEQAIAEAEKQEPVAWVEVKDTHEGPYEFHGKELLPKGKHNLYTHPQPAQPKHEWVGLTDEDVNEWTPEIHDVVRAIEAKLKEKNT